MRMLFDQVYLTGNKLTLEPKFESEKIRTVSSLMCCLFYKLDYIVPFRTQLDIKLKAIIKASMYVNIYASS